ncbi:hypothetical protein A2U01_0117181, partial [Trifolium medium]|nr:hypothetical protein [Trifolium medium]
VTSHPPTWIVCFVMMELEVMTHPYGLS